ncbi:MAG: flagellar hook-length control protein FliK [Sneathiella sp.]|nr:flagellar hook-length control protein FliK [Sneathiella sp.]
MDITQVAHNKDHVFSRTPQFKSEPADDFDRYIDAETSDASDYDVRDTREADHHQDDYHDDEVDSASDTESSENDTDKKTAADEPNSEGVTETAPTSISELINGTSAEADQTATTGSNATQVAESKTATSDQDATSPKGEDVNTQATIGDAAGAKTANPNAATPAEAAQAAVLNGPASETAKARMAGSDAVASTATAETASKHKSPIASATDKKLEVAVQQTSAAQQTAAAQPNKSGKVQTAQNAEVEVATNAQQKAAPTALEKMRADEMSRMSEKDVLSQKLSELLTAAKGKIVGIQSQSSGAANGSAGPAGLASSQNLMQASTNPATGQMTPPPTSTAVGTVTQNVAQAEIPIIVPNADVTAPVAAPTQTGGADLSQTGTLATTTGAVTGVDSTSASSTSQANLAARANAQAGSPAEQVSTQLMQAAKDGNDKIKVQLHPAELGRVDIKLEIAQDGRVMAVIAADNPESLDLLQQDSKALEQALKDAGFETDQNSLNFSLNQGSEDQGQTADANGSTHSAEAEEEITLETQLAALNAQNATSSGLNIRV